MRLKKSQLQEPVRTVESRYPSRSDLSPDVSEDIRSKDR